MFAQVLILRELLILAQGQELRLALGLWCWLLWTGLGALLGGRLSPAAVSRDHLAIVLGLLGLFLPATVLAAAILPGAVHPAAGHSLPLQTTLLLFLALLAPFGLTSGYFFPCACKALPEFAAAGAVGRVYWWETLGAALGVLLLQLLLLGRFAGLYMSLGAGLTLTLAAGILAGSRRLALVAATLFLIAGCLLAPRLEHWQRDWQWPGRQVLAAVDSPYARLAATREAGQVSFFANKLWWFTDPDPLTAEHEVQIALLSHPEPRRVLLLGGGVAGLGAEILKTASIEHLDYVELDPFLVRLAQELAPGATALGRDPRVEIIYQDARLFLETTRRRYDVILMALPEPKSAQLNRFYTVEFFRITAGHLTAPGVFSFSLPGSETSLHPLRAAYLAMVAHTLSRVFPEVLAFPGERVRFLASGSPGTLAADPRVLMQRLQERRLDLRYVRDYYLLDELSPARQAYLRQIFARQPPEINRDLRPGCYYYDLLLSSMMEGRGGQEVFLSLRRLSGYALWAALTLFLALWWIFLRRRLGPRCLFQVVVMGLGGMTLEIVVLVLYQVAWGSLYRQLGLLIAAFMAGMAAGGAAGVRLGNRPGAGAVLAAAQAGLAVLALTLIGALGLPAGSLAARWPVLAQGAYALALAAGGLGGGLIFSLSAALWTRVRPLAAAGGSLYAADLLGATLGSLGASLLLIPVWGLLPALYLVAALHAAAAVVALSR
jgi:spermidine synthase